MKYSKYVLGRIETYVELLIFQKVNLRKIKNTMLLNLDLEKKLLKRLKKRLNLLLRKKI